MSDRDRKIVISLFLIVIMSMLVVAMSLPNLELRAGTPFPSGEGRGDEHSPALSRNGTPPGEYSGSLLKGIVALIFLASTFLILANFITRINRKSFLWGVLGLLILVALLKLIPSTPIAQPSPEIMDSISPDLASPPTYAVSPLGEPPQVWRWIVVGVLIMLVLVFVFWLLMRRKESVPAQDMILQEAEKAVDALKTGEDLKSVILRCYQKMGRILREEQGIERNENMTAREFLELLIDKGISPSAVRQLTLLFEAARYGAFPLSEREERIGLDCLQEIISDCRRGKE